MRSWGNMSDRLDGKNDFARQLQAHPEELEPCQSIPGHARKKFAEWGSFYLFEKPPIGGFPANIVPIPEDIVFEIFASKRDYQGKRVKRVVLIVDLGDGSELAMLDDVQVWRCTYTPYRGGTDPIAHDR